ncbi:MAG: Lacal_2735 family protein [Bacteroidia bacterium]
MFSFFKKAPGKKLEKEYKKYMEEYFRLSTSNRAESDKAFAKAEEILKELEKLKQKNG